MKIIIAKRAVKMVEQIDEIDKFLKHFGYANGRAIIQLKLLEIVDEPSITLEETHRSIYELLKAKRNKLESELIELGFEL